MRAPVKEIANIVDYLMLAEKNHFSVSHHQIHDDLQVVKQWLAIRGGSASPTLPPSNWKQFTYEIVKSFCSEMGRTTFTLQELQRAKRLEIENFSLKNKHPFDKIRQQLQYLRQDGAVTFLDNNGTYSLVATAHF